MSAPLVYGKEVLLRESRRIGNRCDCLNYLSQFLGGKSVRPGAWVAGGREGRVLVSQLGTACRPPSRSKGPGRQAWIYTSTRPVTCSRVTGFPYSPASSPTPPQRFVLRPRSSAAP